MRLTVKPTILSLILILVLSACNMPSSTPDVAATLQAVYTLQAGQTQTVSTPFPLPTIGFPTLPPVTTAPSLTPRTPTPPSVPITYCDWVDYVKDVTVPDGTVYTPGTQFTKTWRLQNIGTCTWTRSYALVFSSGNIMNGAAVLLPNNVSPGQTVDVSVNLTAPASEGSYRAYWMLRNAAGTFFGLGGAASDPFWVDIKVVGGMTTVFDFAASYCTNAIWRSGAGNLDGCPPGNSSGNKGYALKVDQPQLENGQKYNGSGILTVPENVSNGNIQGYYQPFTVQKGDRFRAIINCEYLANGCNAIFRLDYQIGDGPVNTIWQFTEAYEGEYYPIDTDLSPLAGYQAKFILTVLANGSPTGDRPVWVAPRIDRPINNVTPSTPSATPSATMTVTASATGIPPTVTVTGTATSIPNTTTPTLTGTATMTATTTATVTPTPP